MIDFDGCTITVKSQLIPEIDEAPQKTWTVMRLSVDFGISREYVDDMRKNMEHLAECMLGDDYTITSRAIGRCEVETDSEAPRPATDEEVRK